MKLSNETLTVLKNFGAINQGLMFKKGKTLKTVSSQKNILAEVNIVEEIPNEFGVYDLNNFLSVVSLHKDSPTFEFEEKHVLITGNSGRSQIKYRFCSPTMITTPPDKQFSMPDAEIKIKMSSEDFDWIMRAAAVLASPQICIESDGNAVSLVTLDLQNDAAHSEILRLPIVGNGSKYRMLFKTENMTKILPGTYEVSISSKGISHFRNENLPLQYWVTIESGSTYSAD
jgi:hypothetical protein